eukprot:985311-Rhodomonas_salina.1
MTSPRPQYSDCSAGIGSNGPTWPAATEKEYTASRDAIRKSEPPMGCITPRRESSRLAVGRDGPSVYCCLVKTPERRARSPMDTRGPSASITSRCSPSAEKTRS